MQTAVERWVFLSYYILFHLLPTIDDFLSLTPHLVSTEGRDAPEDDSSESEGEETSLSQDTKPRTSNSQPSSTVHRPKPRSGAAWSVDSGSDDSRRWSDTISIDEKDGFVFVNYSEGQMRPGIQSQQHSQPNSAPPHGPVPQPLQPSSMEARSYNKLKPGTVDKPA